MRQILHMLIGTIIIIGLLLVPRPLSIILLFIIFLVSVLFSILARKNKVSIVDFFIKNIERKNDEISFPGKGFIFFFAGCLLAVKLFPLDIALASIAILTFGDSIANMTRKVYPIKNNGIFKNFAGSFVGLVVSFFAALIFVSPIYAGIAAIIGMLAESVYIRLGQSNADDNIIVPLAAGTALYVLRFLIKV